MNATSANGRVLGSWRGQIAARVAQHSSGSGLSARALAAADQAEFYWKVINRILRGRVRKHWNEALRQTYLLAVTTGSVVLIIGLVFAFGLAIGIQGVYGARLVGAPDVAGAFTAIANLREIIPYAFSYMMAAKVSTGFVAELGTMGITEEIDALDVQGLDSIAYLASTRLLAAWIILPFLYAIAIAVAFIGSYLVVVVQIGAVSSGGYLALFWQYQNATDYLFSGIKGMLMATFAVLVGCYYGYTVRTGGPAAVGRATARAMVVNLIGIHFIGIVTSQLFWGGSPNLPIGG
jgi:phospholipid/cholesterol/gamma-HCH transport system permease protein